MMNLSDSKILVPIDFSDQSLIALEQAARLAKVLSSELTLLNVVEDTWVVFKLFSEENEKKIKKEIEQKLDELAKEVSGKTGVIVNTLTARGKVYNKIVEVADMINASLIVMGTSGASGFKNKFIGSNALRVVRETTCPVITIKGKKHREGCRNIVLPLDLTKETKQKVNAAIKLAKYFDARIRVVSVLLTLDEFIVNRLTRNLNQVKNFIGQHGVDCTAEIVKGIKGEERLADVVLDYAKKVEGDLIVIMTQQEQEWTPYFIGSSAMDIINGSDIPVMSIVPRDI